MAAETISIPSMFALGVALAIDAASVAAAQALAAREVRARDALKVAILFGGFQALMPLLGAVLGASIGPLVEQWDHWIAFVLLAVLGAKMIYDAIKHDQGRKPSAGNPFASRTLLLLAIATSIDAFAAGITLSMIGAPITGTLIVIGLTTALLSVLGLYAGRRFGKMFGARLEIFGGLLLIGFGLKILIEHLQLFG